jgi:hypothetical protein
MNKSEFYSEFLFRNQTEGVSQKLSITTFCLREGVAYFNFIRWYCENKKRIREDEMKKILCKSWVDMPLSSLLKETNQSKNKTK